MKVIGLTGKARAGKDTVADLIQSNVQTGYNCHLYSLADPLKQACSEMFGVPLDNFYDDAVKDEPDEFWTISPREMAQKLGTEGGREVFGDDLWLRRCEQEMNRISDINSFNGIFIIRDVRFENEAAFVRKLGGTVFHVERGSLGEGVVRDHASEAGVEFYPNDVRIHNNGTLEELEKQTQDALRFLHLTNPHE